MEWKKKLSGKFDNDNLFGIKILFLDNFSDFIVYFYFLGFMVKRSDAFTLTLTNLETNAWKNKINLKYTTLENSKQSEA